MVACVGRGGMKLMVVVQRHLQGKYQPATCRVYEMWIRRFLRYHLPVHPRQVGQEGIAGFVRALNDAELSARTINQALVAIGVLYNNILEQPVDLSKVRPRQPRTIAVGCSRNNIDSVLMNLTGREWLLARLVYGSGLSNTEAARLTMSQVDLDQHAIILENRSTVLPKAIVERLSEQIVVAQGYPGNVSGYVFPSSRLVKGRCWHVSPSSLQKALKIANDQAGVMPRVDTRALRQSFMEHLLEAGYDVRTVQKIMGYTRVERVQKVKERIERRNVVSPMDTLEIKL